MTDWMSDWKVEEGNVWHRHVPVGWAIVIRTVGFRSPTCSSCWQIPPLAIRDVAQLALIKYPHGHARYQ